MSTIYNQLRKTPIDHFMISLHELPTASLSDSYIEYSNLLCKYNFGAVFIIDLCGRLKGIVTDGDVRRSFKNHGPLPLFTLKASNFATTKPKRGYLGNSLYDALTIMENEKQRITCLPIVNNQEILCGAITLHSIVSFILSLE